MARITIRYGLPCEYWTRAASTKTGLTVDTIAFRPLMLVLDVAIAACVVALVVAAFERWRRRHQHTWQLHIIDLLALLLVVACLLGACRWYDEKLDAQDRATTELLRTGIRVHSIAALPKWTEMPRRLLGARLFRRPAAVGGMIPAQTFMVQGIANSDEAPYLGDNELEPIRELSAVEWIRLPSQTSRAGPWTVVVITDRGLAHLRGLRHLRMLDIEGNKITDAGLVHLSGLSKLEILDIAGTEVTDAGLVQLLNRYRISRSST